MIAFTRFIACSVDVERVVTGSEIVEFTCGPDNFINPRVAEFNDIARLQVNQVVVLHAVISLFELRYILTELVFHHQVAVQQQFNGVVERRPADPVVLVFHENIQGFYVKMTLS